MKTILVTGAKGTVGNYVLGLAEAGGYRVIASDLTTAGLRAPVRGEVRPFDLSSAGSFEPLVRGCDYVIHTAAELDAGAKFDELAGVNADAVTKLYEAAESAGVQRFVHMSTAMLYKPFQRTRLHEDVLIAPRGAHGMSKHAAETFLRAKGGSARLPWTILRAAPVYGRRGRHFAASLLVIGPILRLGTPVLPRFSGGPTGSMVHAEDVARALLFVVDHAATAGEIYNVADDDPMPLGDRLSLTFDAYGLRTVPHGRLPRPVLGAVGRLFRRSGPFHAGDVSALALWKLVTLRHGLKPALRPRLDREALTLLYDDLVVDASKLRSLGWRPRFPHFMEGWRQVLRWYQAEGWVPRYTT